VRNVENLERKMLVAQAALKIEDTIREFARVHGDIFKSMGVDVKAVQLTGLDIFGEAYEALKTKVQQAQSRAEKK